MLYEFEMTSSDFGISLIFIQGIIYRDFFFYRQSSSVFCNIMIFILALFFIFSRWQTSKCSADGTLKKTVQTTLILHEQCNLKHSHLCSSSGGPGYPGCDAAQHAPLHFGSVGVHIGHEVHPLHGWEASEQIHNSSDRRNHVSDCRWGVAEALSLDDMSKIMRTMSPFIICDHISFLFNFDFTV